MDLPVFADLENGFDDTPEGAATTIREAGTIGLVGGSIEDATGDPAAPIYGMDQAVRPVEAAASRPRRSKR